MKHPRHHASANSNQLRTILHGLLLGLWLILATVGNGDVKNSILKQTAARHLKFSERDSPTNDADRDESSSGTDVNYKSGDSTAKATIESSFSDNRVCFDWNNTHGHDEWWARHPDWEASTTTDHQACLAPVQDPAKRDFFQSIYDSQHNSPNNNCTLRFITSSGFSRDVDEIAEGLFYAWKHERPFMITNPPGELWHYAAFKPENRRGRPPVCPSADYFCYFLPLITNANNSSCPTANSNGEHKRTDIGNVYDYDGAYEEVHHWLVEYATRPKLWLRHKVHKFVSKTLRVNKSESNSESKCAVLHVRRGDVVLHGDQSRKYYPIESYLQKLQTTHPTIRNIWLFTDDADAISEAHDLFPNYHWKYTNKTRHKGSSGGWENQLPSAKADQEVVVILSELQLAKRCDVFVHGPSGFANLIRDTMRESNRTVDAFDLGEDDSTVFDTKNKASELVLKKYLEYLKSKQQNENNKKKNNNNNQTTTARR